MEQDISTAGDTPRTPTQLVLAAMWADAFGLPRVRLDWNFFELGGHSLLATEIVAQARDAFQLDLSARHLLQRPSVRQLAEEIDRLRAGDATGGPEVIPRVPRDPGALARVPAALMQETIWQQLEPDLRRSHAAYHLVTVYRIVGRLDLDSLAWSLDQLVRRHEILRTGFAAADDRLVQVIHPRVDVLLPVTDLAGRGAALGRDPLADVVRAVNQPFDLTSPPLFRAGLARLARDDHLLVVAFHHLVADAWSMAVFFRELTAHYATLRKVAPARLPDLSIQYADFAAWHRRRALGVDLEYWRRWLSGSTPLRLGGDHARGPTIAYRPERMSFMVPEPLTAALRGWGAKQDATLFVILLAGWKSVLWAHARHDDVSVLSMTTGRTLRATRPLLGLFANDVVLRTELSGGCSLTDAAALVRETVLAAYEHEHMPYADMIEGMGSSLTGPSPWDVWFLLEETDLRATADVAGTRFESPIARARHSGELRPGRAAAAPVAAGPPPTAHWSGPNVTVRIVEERGTLHGTVTFNRELFEGRTIKHLVTDYLAVLATMPADPGRRLHALGLAASS